MLTSKKRFKKIFFLIYRNQTHNKYFLSSFSVNFLVSKLKKHFKKINTKILHNKKFDIFAKKHHRNFFQKDFQREILELRESILKCLSAKFCPMFHLIVNRVLFEG